jgi:hypothetical protein
MKGTIGTTEVQKLILGLFITAIFSVWFGFAFTHDLLPQIGESITSILPRFGS